MDPLSRFALQIAFRSCPCNESKKDCSGEHGKVELFINAAKKTKAKCSDFLVHERDFYFSNNSFMYFSILPLFALL